LPDLFFDAVPIWNAFIELNASRTVGFGVSNIPYSEITNWLDENLVFSLEDRQHYRKFIGIVDSIWVGHMNDKSSDSKSGAQPSNKRGEK
jgi:hypothetical protein